MFSNIKHKIDRPFVETAHTEEGHFYKTESGKTYPSITTVFRLLDDKKWYPFWVAKVARDEGINEAQAEIRCKEIGGNSMEMGNIVHKLAEEYLSNATVNKPSSKIEEIDPMDLFVPLVYMMELYPLQYSKTKEINMTNNFNFLISELG